MSEPAVIIHGWSDDSSTFNKLATFIKSNLGPQITNIDLGDWISMNDDVTYVDLAEAMNRAWSAFKLPTESRSVNVIVHSTGALVTREWMTRYFTPDSVPIKRFLMLAPANFGSPLAHKGRSFLGRAFKGWGNDNFETGNSILKGLELASPYSWDLAHKDLFTSDSWYGSGRILATVLVGNKGYDGIRSIANEIGSDGTVRISTANLNSNKIHIELDEDQTPKNPILSSSNGDIAFGIVNGINHSTITLSEQRKQNPHGTLESLILRALQIGDVDYLAKGASFPWQDEINTAVGNTLSTSQRMQNLVVRVRDNLGNKVDEYFVEFYRTERADHDFEKALFTRFLETVHPYGDDRSYRSLYLNISELDNIRSENVKFADQLFVSLTAQPIYQDKTRKNQPVGYAPVSATGSGGLKLSTAQLVEVFQAHKTSLIDIVLTRKLSEDVFRIKKAN